LSGFATLLTYVIGIGWMMAKALEENGAVV
jgi:hypothetical protein